MKLIAFDTAVVPAEIRLETFRAAASQFRVDPVGDPAAFGSHWRMLVLGDINVIHSHSSPLRYRRDAAMIAADGEDRITLHCYLAGGETGEIDGRAVETGPSGAMVWDLAVPFDIRSTAPIELVIVTLPRHFVAEVLPAPQLAGPIAASPELALAVAQARHLIDHAEDLPDAAAAFLGRALRDMLAVALLPAYRSARPMAQPDAPLLQRITDLIDARLSEPEPEVEEVAATLEVDAARVAEVAAHFGGLPLLAERRRLLAAYRLLSDPRETDTVETIAQRCGFASLPRFSRRFRSVFHTSARDLRRFGRGHLPRWAGAYHVEALYGPMIARGGSG